MNYVIKNNKGVYIRLNKNGKPVTCSEDKKTIFEYSKAKNIVENMQKTLKRLNFIVDPLPDIISIKEFDENNKPKVIITENKEISEDIVKWVEKFKVCDDILREAQKRKNELNKKLSNIDKQFCNMVHEIEFEGKVDLYGGWLERNKIKENREKRRKIKEELSIISCVIKMNFNTIDIDALNRTLLSLKNRKYNYRVIDEED